MSPCSGAGRPHYSFQVLPAFLFSNAANLEDEPAPADHHKYNVREEVKFTEQGAG
jgi:hypothetical protein